MALTVGMEQLRHHVGKEVGISEWLEVDQSRIDRFAAATGDYQYIHVDPQRAVQTPFGTTIAHGFLTLSLLVQMSQSGSIRLENQLMQINYGCDRVRFISPVKVNSRIRGRFQLLGVEEKHPRQWLLKYQVTVDIDGQEKPALVAQWLAMTVAG